jgi:peroxin-1
MASASSLARFNLSDTSLETIEIDPQYAQALGFAHGDVVRYNQATLADHG